MSFSKTSSSVLSNGHSGPSIPTTQRARGRSTRGVTNLNPLHVAPNKGDGGGGFLSNMSDRPTQSNETPTYVAGGTYRSIMAPSQALSSTMPLSDSERAGMPMRWQLQTPDINKALHNPPKPMRKAAPQSILSKKPRKSSGWIPKDENGRDDGDSVAVDGAVEALKSKIHNSNTKTWLKDLAEGNLDGKQVIARQSEIAAMLPPLGIKLTPAQHKLLMQRFFSTNGDEVPYNEFASKVKPDRGYVPDAAKSQLMYAGRPDGFPTAASTIPSVKAETAKRLFREYMEPRRLRSTLKAMGLSSRTNISYSQFRSVLKTINIRLQDAEFDKLCEMFDPKASQGIVINDISITGSQDANPAPVSRGMIPRAKQDVTDKVNYIDPQTTLLSPRSSLRSADMEVYDDDELPVNYQNTMPEVQTRLYNMLNENQRRIKNLDPTSGRMPFGYDPSDYDAVTSPYMVGEAPTRYGLRENLRYNTARTVAPHLDNPILPYAQASQGGSHFDTGSSDRYLPKDQALRKMQIEDKKSLARANAAKRAIKMDQSSWEQDRQKMTDESMQKAFQLRIDNLVSQRLQYVRNVTGSIHPQIQLPGNMPSLKGDWIGGGENQYDKFPATSNNNNSMGAQKSISWNPDSHYSNNQNNSSYSSGSQTARARVVNEANYIHDQSQINATNYRMSANPDIRNAMNTGYQLGFQ